MTLRVKPALKWAQATLSKTEMVGAAVALGTSAFGIGLIGFAFVDLEPMSKVGALVLGGIACVLTGGLSGIRILTKQGRRM